MKKFSQTACELRSNSSSKRQVVNTLVVTGLINKKKLVVAPKHTRILIKKQIITSRVGLKTIKTLLLHKLGWMNKCSSLRQFLPVRMPKISAKELFSRYFNLIGMDFALPIILCYKKQYLESQGEAIGSPKRFGHILLLKVTALKLAPMNSRMSSHQQPHIPSPAYFSHGGQCSYNLEFWSSVHSHF